MKGSSFGDSDPNSSSVCPLCIITMIKDLIKIKQISREVKLYESKDIV